MVVQHLALHEARGFIDDLVQVEGRCLHRGLPGQSAQALDDLTGAFSIAYHPLDCTADFLELRHVALEPAQAGFSVRDDAGEWLIDLVGNRSSELSKGGGTGALA